MEKKKVKYFDDFGSGFKVRIANAPMIKIRGEWVLDMDQNRLQRTILSALAAKPVRLSGNEIRFIRIAFEMTLAEFGQKFDVSHAAVIKWEKSANQSTEMNWATEKDIRLFVASRLDPKCTNFIAVYKNLEEKADDAEMLVKIDAKKAA